MNKEAQGSCPTVGRQEPVLTFRLPAPPPSMNSAYNVLFSMRRVEMKPEVRQYKTMMKMYVPPFEVKDKDQVAFEMEVHQDWNCKNGNYKKQDIQNMAKVLIDLISEKQGWDDKHVWCFTIKKVQDSNSTGVFVKESLVVAHDTAPHGKGECVVPSPATNLSNQE